MKKIISLATFFTLLALTTKQALAVCPVCTIAVGVGLGISRWLGIDDTVTGVWIGGLIISSGLWMGNWIISKKWKVPYPKLLSVIFLYVFTIVPLWIAKTIGHPKNTLWGIDKILLGIIVGSVAFMVSVWLDQALRKRNNGQVFIYYQKVILPLFLLTVASFTFYLIT